MRINLMVEESRGDLLVNTTLSFTTDHSEVSTLPPFLTPAVCVYVHACENVVCVCTCVCEYVSVACVCR